MDNLILVSDVVVYCEEKDVQTIRGDQGWIEKTATKCKVLQTFKGDVAPGTDLTAEYSYLLERRSLLSSGKEQFPPGKVLLFLLKDNSGSYKVVDAKLVQTSGVFCYLQFQNPGGLYLAPQQPENIKLANGEKYGEKELLEDFAIALKRPAPEGKIHGIYYLGRPF